MSTATKSPRTSPKFFRNHQLQPASFNAPNGQFLVNNQSTHHSITVSSQPALSSNHQQLQLQRNATQLTHVAVACENGINNNTGIKQGPLSGKSQPITNRSKVEKLNGGLNGKVQSKQHERAMKCRTNVKSIKRISSSRYSRGSHAKSQNVFVESIPFLQLQCAPEVQSRNHPDLDVSSIFHAPPLSPLHHLESDIIQELSRDERLVQKRIQLRHRVEQFKGIQRYRTTERSRMRFSQTLKLLKHLDLAKKEM